MGSCSSITPSSLPTSSHSSPALARSAGPIARRLAVVMTLVLLVKGILVNSPSFPEGPGSVSGAPHLPDGFAGTFTSRYVEAGGLRQHVVTGGDGPPLLLGDGWPPDRGRLGAGLAGAGPR